MTRAQKIRLGISGALFGAGVALMLPPHAASTRWAGPDRACHPITIKTDEGRQIEATYCPTSVSYTELRETTR